VSNFECLKPADRDAPGAAPERHFTSERLQPRLLQTDRDSAAPAGILTEVVQADVCDYGTRPENIDFCSSQTP
jgi:hypothetical protein